MLNLAKWATKVLAVLRLASISPNAQLATKMFAWCPYNWIHGVTTTDSAW
jgi:hypothetical protein